MQESRIREKIQTSNIPLILLSLMGKRCIYLWQEPEFKWEKEPLTFSSKEVLNYNSSYRTLELHNLKNHPSKRANY